MLKLICKSNRMVVGLHVLFKAPKQMHQSADRVSVGSRGMHMINHHQAILDETGGDRHVTDDALRIKNAHVHERAVQ